MNEREITSRDNALMKHARAVRDRKVRSQVFVEGLRLCEEVRHSLSVDDIMDVIYTERMARDPRGASLLNSLRQEGGKLSCVSESVFASISDTKTPQGIAILASRPETDQSSFSEIPKKLPLLLILHRINNPSNAGALLRTAEAAGVTGVILTAGSTDIFSPKALRGAMGASFRLRLWTEADFFEALNFCRERGIRTVCAGLQAGRAHTDVDWTVPSALIVGSEATGLEPSETAAADESLRIPMRPPVESLNVAVATGIVLYEAARQRAESSEQ
ncbi:MAG TPA: RNA methyltransferase [Pyrinomonadaceae bacterium]|nr:RNA methyltransferase [Pyrinomonadaceae bacterium]